MFVASETVSRLVAETSYLGVLASHLVQHAPVQGGEVRVDCEAPLAIVLAAGTADRVALVDDRLCEGGRSPAYHGGVGVHEGQGAVTRGWGTRPGVLEEVGDV